MNSVLLGNIVAIAGSVLMAVAGLVKNKRGILLTQCAMFILLSVANLILGGVTGALVNMVSLARNILCIYIAFTTPWKLLFITIQAVSGLLMNSMGLIGLTPVIAGCVFTWYLDTKNVTLLKCTIIVGQLLWCFYDYTIQNYVALAFDILTIVTNIVGIWQLQKKKGGAAV